MSDKQQGTIYRWVHDTPLDLAARLTQLQQQALLPAETSWWFGWNELEIALPRQLRATVLSGENWDVLHIFSPRVELRCVRQGRTQRGILLTEQQLPAELMDWGEPELFQTIPSLRILWGNRLRLPEGDRRGVVAFPRPLDYGIAEDETSYADALVADVQLYHDAEARLHTVRYVRLRHLSPGDSTGRVRPYAGGAYVEK